MSIMHIRHQTTYTYSAPVIFGRHRLVLRPREGHDQRVESLTLHIQPAHQLSWIRDVFGNSVAIVDFLAPAAELSITSDVHFRRTHQETSIIHPPWQVPFPVVYDPLESVVAAAYRATSYQEDTSAVTEFLTANNLLRATYAEEALDRLNQTIHNAFAYNRRPEKGVQSPAQTLDLRTGSCRDAATLMMEAARCMGMAARFASGYLDCPAAEAARASTHAWVEVYLPSLGWIGFDPTLGQRASHKHIACGLSNHPRGVMPISGTFTRQPGAEYLGLTVSVEIRKDNPADTLTPSSPPQPK